MLISYLRLSAKLKALNHVSRNNPFHPLYKGRTIWERKNPRCTKPCTETFQCTHFENSCHPACVYKKRFCQRRSSQASLIRTNSSKAMFEENVRKFKTRLISTGCPKQKVGGKLSNKNWEHTKQLHKKNLPFVTQFQPSLYQTWKTYLRTNGIY